MISEATTWRGIGDTTFAAFQDVLTRHRSPLAPEARLCYDAGLPHTKLLLAQLQIESRFGTEGLATSGGFNPLGLRPRNGDGFARFGSWAEAIRFWLGKIVDPDYAYAGTESLEDYVHVYAPASDGNDEIAYRAAVRSLIATLPNALDGASSPPSLPKRGRVPKPPVVRRWVTTKRIGHGREADQERAGRIVGTCHHTMDGYLLGTDDVFHDPSWPGLTDYGIGGSHDDPALDGVIYEWIDPESRIVPWANGTVGDARAPYGDAPAFIAAFGRNAVNARLRSIETSDGVKPDGAKSRRQMESLCLLTAWIHSEQAGQTAETFAWNMHHREFGVEHQGCPGAYIVERVDAIQARTRAIIHAYQTGTSLDPPLLITYPRGWSGGVIPQPGASSEPSEPVYVRRVPLPGPVTDRVENGHTFIVCQRTLTSRAETAPVLQFADPSAPPVRSPLRKGTRVAITYVTIGEDGNLWFLTKNGGRIPASAFVES